MSSVVATDILPADNALCRYRRVFYAAAGYNLGWGAGAILAPGVFVSLAALPPASSVLVQGLGLLVLVYAPAFWWAAREPSRHAHLIAVALLGKSLAVAGFAWAAATGRLAAEFGVTVVSNDAIWILPFALYLRSAAALRGGWSAFLGG